LSTLS